MADLSFTIDVSDLDSKIAAISAKASDASSAVAARSAAWDAASNTASVASVAAAAASNKASQASVAAAAASNKASVASVAAAAASDGASKGSVALAKIGTDSATWDKASDASAKALSMASTIIRSIPAATSRRVKRLVYMADSAFKFVASSNAQA